MQKGQWMKWSILGGLLLWAGVAQAATINLAWDYPTTGTSASGFTVWRQDGCVGTFLPRGGTALSIRTFADTTAQAGNTYCWYVTAHNADGEDSVPSNTVSFRVPLEAPPAPTNLRGALVR